MQPLVLSVAVHYNSPDDCIQMLSSLVAVNYSNHKIIVVDNCSTGEAFDKLNDYIINFLPVNCELIKNKSNVGFGGGINFGVEYSLKYDPQYIHVINTDAVVINPDYVADLIVLLKKNKDIGIVGPAVLKEDRKELQNTVLPFVTLTSAINFRKNYSDLSYIEQTPVIIDVECVNGVCFMMPTNIYRMVGGFDESYFMYGEEQDLCYSIYKAGYRRVFWSGLSIVHYGAEKSNSHLIDWRFVHVRKNQVAYLSKHHNFLQAFLLASLFSISLLLKLLKGSKLHGLTTASILKQYYSSTFRK
jgi:N-acetylglucosaminyl-diphospho-decaprenol L-rhamnosyltransferase